MKEFKMNDNAGNTATIQILDGMGVAKAKQLLKNNGVNDGDNFYYSNLYFIYKGMYFYLFCGNYCVEYSNQQDRASTKDEMMSRIDKLTNI